MDFFFSVQELLDIEGVLGVIIGGVLVVRVLGQVVLVAQKRAHTPQLQDAFAAILADAEAGIVLVDLRWIAGSYSRLHLTAMSVFARVDFTIALAGKSPSIQTVCTPISTGSQDFVRGEFTRTIDISGILLIFLFIKQQ